jgi:hypothetical protein
MKCIYQTVCILKRGYYRGATPSVGRGIKTPKRVAGMSGSEVVLSQNDHWVIANGLNNILAERVFAIRMNQHVRRLWGAQPVIDLTPKAVPEVMSGSRGEKVTSYSPSGPA